jgi:hypothetical protein
MRTKTLLIAAAALAAGLASSMAQSNVYSLNVVGYVNSTLTGGSKYTAVANPLTTTNNTIGGLLAGLPAGSTVLKWNPSAIDYDAFLKQGFGIGWDLPAALTTTLAPGEAVMILIEGSTITNTWVGEVVQGNKTNSFPGGLKFVGNIHPLGGPASGLGLTNNVPSGSTLMKWNVGTQDFDPYLKTGFGIGWDQPEPSIAVAEGFFIDASSGAFDWIRNFTVQ